MYETINCSQCNLTFPDHDQYHQHKINSPRHITCKICSIDFRNEVALKLHFEQIHAAEQDLHCPGCRRKFVRAGSLVAHIELDGCKLIPKEYAEKMRKGEVATLRASPVSKLLEPLAPSPVAMKSVMPHMRKAFKNNATYTEQSKLSTSSGTPTKSRLSPDDLIAFELNAPWGPPVSSSEKQHVAEPSILDSDIPWGSPRSSENVALVRLESNMIVANPPSSSRSVKDEPNPFDPDQAGFDAMKYFNIYLKKFKCPHPRCAKSHESRNAFIAHLKSVAHRNEKLQCPSCLRFFGTFTALTQHCESQGVRCKVRKTITYNRTVNDVTAGTTTIVGRHDDQTIKYAVNPVLVQSASEMTAAHRAAAAERDAAKEDYWSKRAVKW